MCKVFGSREQVKLNSPSEFYMLLGYLAKSDGSTSLVWKHNEEQGAWGSEGRIQIYVDNMPQIGQLKKTAGVGNIKYRVNCNDFVEYICKNHRFVEGDRQTLDAIRHTIPDEFLEDFNNGLNL